MGNARVVEHGASYSDEFDRRTPPVPRRAAIRAPKITFMKIELQLIAAFILSIGGLVLLFCGIFIDPQGEIHSSLLVAFGETATFAGALFGIDYVYKKKK